MRGVAFSSIQYFFPNHGTQKVARTTDTSGNVHNPIPNGNESVYFVLVMQDKIWKISILILINSIIILLVGMSLLAWKRCIPYLS